MSAVEIERFAFADRATGDAVAMVLSAVDDYSASLCISLGADRDLEIIVDRPAAQSLVGALMAAVNAASIRQAIASKTLAAPPDHLLHPGDETFAFVDRSTGEGAAVGILVYDDSRIGLFISGQTTDDVEIVADLSEVMKLDLTLMDAIAAMSSQQLTGLSARRRSGLRESICAANPEKAPAGIDSVFGPSKPCDTVTAEEFARYPVWVWALDEEGVEGQDETWVKPLISGTDVGADIASWFPLITLWIVGTEYLVVGDYDHAADSVSFHFVRPEDREAGLAELKRRSGPVILEAVPTILGQAAVQFQCGGCDPGMDGWQAWRID